MNFVAYAWRNLWRNRRRTLITLSAIALSIMLVQAFHNLSVGVYARMVDEGVRAGSGHLAIYRNGYLAGRDENLGFPRGALDDRLRAVAGVASVLPRIYLPALAQSSFDSRGILLVDTGIAEIDGSLLMVGRQRAAMLAGQRQDLAAVSWETAMPNLANAIKLDYAGQKFIFAIILMIVTIGVVNTMLMSVMERLHEFGGVVFDPVLRAGWALVWMTKIALYVVGLTLLTALYPALKAGRLPSGRLCTFLRKWRTVPMHILIFPIALLATLLFTPPQAAAEDLPGWQWGGSLRSLNLSGEESPGGYFPSYRVSSTRLRLESVWQDPSGWRLESALDHQLLGTDPSGAVPLPGDGVNRRFDLDHSWQHDDGWASRLQVDRLSAAWTTGRLDATVGRQAIGFGRIVIFSPLDNIAPFAPDALDVDIRPGVDAVRLTAHYDRDGQVGAIAVLGDVSRHDSYLATWQDNRAGIDLLALGGILRNRPMFGLGAAGNFGLLGLKTEVAIYEGDRVGEPGGDLHRHMVIAAAEGWYRFDNGLTLICQYLHNGAGANAPDAYLEAYFSAPVQEGLISLLGRDYLLVAPSYELHPLATLNGLLIWNLDDDSWLLRPTLDIDLADNLSLELFWTHTGGESPGSRAFFPEIRSEFGSEGASVGFFMKWFF